MAGRHRWLVLAFFGRNQLMVDRLGRGVAAHLASTCAGGRRTGRATTVPLWLRPGYAKAASDDLPGEVEHAFLAVQYEVHIGGEDDAVQFERERVRVLGRV